MHLPVNPNPYDPKLTHFMLYQSRKDELRLSTNPVASLSQGLESHLLSQSNIKSTLHYVEHDGQSSSAKPGQVPRACHLQSREQLRRGKAEEFFFL